MSLRSRPFMESESEEMKQSDGLCQTLKDPVYRRKFIHSLVMFLSFMFLGLRSAQHPTAFLDLAQITGTNVEQASAFYTAMSVGALLGTFCMGFLFDRITAHTHFLLASTCILGAVTTAAIPWSTNFPLTICLFLVNTFFHCGFDVGGNADFMRTWGMEGKMLMQFLHFSFAVGTIVAPFTVEPFLSTVLDDNSTACQTTRSLRDQDNILTVNQSKVGNNFNISTTLQSGLEDKCKLSESSIHYAYLIAAGLCLLSGIIIIVEGSLYRRNEKGSKKQKEDHRNKQELPLWLTTVMLGLVACLYFFHCASGVTMIGYLMAFCVNGLRWSKDSGTKLSSLFWAGLSVFRLVGVLVAKYLSPSKMLLISTSTVVISISGLWLSVVLGSTLGVWTCVTLAAVGFSVIFPTGIVFLENDVMKMTGKVASVVWIAANMQGVVIPPLLGYLMQEISFMWYIYLALVESVLCLLTYCLIEMMIRVFVSKHSTRDITKEAGDDDPVNTFIPISKTGENTC